MDRESNKPGTLQSASRLLGWILLVGGLALSLLADSLSGIGALSESLKDLGFPAGTLCVAGFLLLALGSVRGHGPKETASSSRPALLDPPREAPLKPGASDLRKLEDRLIAELHRKHEDLRQELHEVSALLEANLEAGALTSLEWPVAAGAELSSQQPRPALRKLGPRAHPSPFSMEEDDEELEGSVELEEKAPDETLLWAQGVDLTASGDLEDRLTGEVVIDSQPFEWDFPVPHPSAYSEETAEETPDEPATPESVVDSEKEPELDRDNIQWFKWGDDDLV